MKLCNEIIEMDKVQIVLVDGTKISGVPIDINYADDTGRPEDEIVIDSATKIISIPESEIESFQME